MIFQIGPEIFELTALRPEMKQTFLPTSEAQTTDNAVVPVSAAFCVFGG